MHELRLTGKDKEGKVSNCGRLLINNRAEDAIQADLLFGFDRQRASSRRRMIASGMTVATLGILKNIIEQPWVHL